MEIDKNFEGYKKWKEGTRQHVIPEPGETREDAIEFMRDAIYRFKLNGKFTFNANRVEFVDGEYIFILHHICKSRPLGLVKFGDKIHPDHWK
ncbi:hypothetical protein [Dyadobacter fermentans]|uniref:hypothetical protein n=1 Tax=Dyadobacter fermentans TaxID=94254 RepID=UPI001CC0516C|nr:hypothetical protein [Dyadobacter fermentans]MBZ1362006.1 hypothetical protein [Dyadobacter fermentans]